MFSIGMGEIEQLSPNQSFAQQKSILREREEKIKEFAQMNSKLNEMKQKFKRELMSEEQLMMKVAPQQYLDQ